MNAGESRTTPHARGALTVTRVSDANSFRALDAEWDALYERSSCRSVFLRWGWLHSWWCVFGEGHGLRIYAARDATGRLVGIAPLYRRIEHAPWPIGVLTFLGTQLVSSDFLDFIVESPCEESVAAALFDAIAGDSSDIDWIRWCDILDSSVVARRIVPAARSAGWPVEVKVAEYCPYLALPESLDALLSARGKSLRDNFRRATRKLEALGLVFDAVDDAATVPAALEALYHLHEARWRRKGRQGNFQDRRIRAFHELAVSSLIPGGSLRLYRLRLGDRTLAILYALDDRGVLFYYQAGFDPESPDASIRPHDYSPGIVLIGKVMGDAIHRGRTEFDFLRGDEPAKFRWTGTYRITRTVTAVPNGRWRGRAALRAMTAASAFRTVVRRVLRRPALSSPPGEAS